MFYLQWYHPIITLLASIITLAVCGFRAIQGYVLAAVIGGAIGFLLLTVLFVILILKDKGMQEVDTMTHFADVITRLDPEGREILADKFPKTIQYAVAHGQIRKKVEGPNVPLDTWLNFLKDSNDRSTSPVRNWYTKDMPERHWWAIIYYLQDKGYVLEDSAAGNHSYLWSGNSFRRLWAYWGTVDRNLVDMSDWQTDGGEEAVPDMSGQQVYAHTTDPLPHLNNASGGG